MRRLGYFLFLSLFLTTIYANVPENLMFHNKPIDALCFFNMDMSSKEINLNQCGLAKGTYTVTGRENNLIEKGYIGYNWHDSATPGVIQGYSYYKFFNAGNNQYWLYTVNNGGGSGEFTTLYLLKRKNTHTLEIKTLSAGDRCNGGLQDVAELNNELSFSVNLTAYDFITLAKKSPPSIKAYDDLAACAVCCIAKAYYKLKLNEQPKLNYVALGSMNAEEMPQQGIHQPCFNKLLASYPASGKAQLKQNSLDEFAVQFNQKCMKN
jgi:hypothetical protein